MKTRRWTLVLKNLESNDSGHYRCDLCNIHGCIDHTTHLIVERDKILSNKHSNEPIKSHRSPIPRFTHPDQLNSEILKQPGQMLNIRCAADGKDILVKQYSRPSPIAVLIYFSQEIQNQALHGPKIWMSLNVLAK